MTFIWLSRQFATTLDEKDQPRKSVAMVGLMISTSPAIKEVEKILKHEI